MAKDNSYMADSMASMLFQGWLSLALWMIFGLLLEGLLGYKFPAYLNDSQRRELFQLAHAHGALCNLRPFRRGAGYIWRAGKARPVDFRQRRKLNA